MTQRDIFEAVRANKDPVALRVTRGDGYQGFVELSVTLDDEKHRISFFELFECSTGVWRLIGEGKDFRRPAELIRWIVGIALARSAANRLGHVP